MCSKMRNSDRPFPVFRSVEVTLAETRREIRLWPFLAGDEPPQFFLGDFSQTVEVCDLVLQRVIGAVKPESAVGASVDSQRTANGVAKLSGSDGVVLRKHLDALGQARALHRHSQPQSKIMDVDSALLGQQGRCQEDPKMPTALAHLQRRLHLVLCQVVLQLEQVLHGVLVVGVDGNPFTALGRGVDGIQADRDLAFQVLADGFLGQHQGYVCSFLAWPEVVVPPCFRVRPHGLHRVGAAVHEQPLVILDDLPGCRDCRCH